MKKGRKKARKDGEPGFYNTEICSVCKAPTKGYSRKDGRSIVHRRASQGNWKKTNSRH